MRFLIKSVFTLAMLAVLAVVALFLFVPKDVVRDQVTVLVKQQTGRELTVGGETSFSFYPDVGVKLGDVTLSNPPGMAGGPMLRMQTLTLELKLAPLLQRRVEVERFVLLRPIFDLRIDRNGRANWEFEKRAAGAGSTAVARPDGGHAPVRAMKAQTGGAGPLAGQSLVQDVRLGAVHLVDGTVQFTDEQSGVVHRLDEVNVALALERLSDPLEAEGDLVWQGEEVAFKGRLGSVLKVSDNQPTPLQLSLTSRLVKSDFKGKVTLGAALSVAGDVSGDTPSIRALARWTGAGLPPGKGLGPASVKGRLAATSDRITFDKATLSLDGMKGRGNVSVKLAGARPYLRAALAVDRLDLNAYLGKGAPVALPPRPVRRKTARPPAPSVTVVPKGPAPKPKPDQSLTDFIDQLNKTDRPAPQVRSWSQRAIDLTGLRTVDADVRLTAGQMLYQAIKVGKSDVTATLRRGVLSANLKDMRLYGGRGTGRMTLNGARAVPAFAAKLNFADVSALPLLKDAAKFDWISGRSRLAVTLSGRGRSESAIVRTLQGNGSFVFSNGAIEGINIAQMVRSLKKGQLSGWRREPAQKTDFSQLSGTFTMLNGVARNSDLKMVGPLVRLGGAGSVDIPREWLDYRIEPKIVASLQGQGGSQDMSGLEIPVKITGPWKKPKIRPDLQELLKDPDKAAKTVKQVEKVIKNLKKQKIRGKDVEKIFKNFLGQRGGGTPQPGQTGQVPQGQAGQPQPAPQGQAGQAQQGQQQVKPEDLLKQLFRR